MESLLCPGCDNIMTKDTKTGQIKFTCHCGYDEREVTSEDTLMASGSLVYQNEIGEEYNKFLRNVAFLPTNPKPDPELNIKCPSCKKGNKGAQTYIRYVRITGDEKIYYVCTCGNAFVA